MDTWVLAMMLGASIFLGGLALLAFLWAIRNGQFDDQEKFLNAAKFDGEDELNAAYDKDEKRKQMDESTK